jgi:hypothetical protein
MLVAAGRKLRVFLPVLPLRKEAGHFSSDGPCRQRRRDHNRPRGECKKPPNLPVGQTRTGALQKARRRMLGIWRRWDRRKKQGEKSPLYVSLFSGLSLLPLPKWRKECRRRGQSPSRRLRSDYRVSPHPVKRSFPPATAKKIGMPGRGCLLAPPRPPAASRGRIPRKNGELVSGRCGKRRPQSQSPPHERTGRMIRRSPGRPMANRAPKTAFLNAPDRTRTCDLRFRKPMLYPAELRALGAFMISPGPYPCRVLVRGRAVAVRRGGVLQTILLRIPDSSNSLDMETGRQRARVQRPPSSRRPAPAAPTGRR